MRIHWHKMFVWMMALLLACGLAAAQESEYEQLFQEAISEAATELDRNTFQLFKPAAESENPAVRLVEGLVADVEYRDNKLNIVINTEESKWQTVIGKGYSAGSGFVFVYPGFDSPTGDEEGSVSFGCALDIGENWIIEYLRRDHAAYGWREISRAYGGESIGRYDEETGIFQPIENTDCNFVCVWLVDGKLEFRYLVSSITYTSTDAFKVEMDNVPADDIALICNEIPEQQKQLITSSITAGNVWLEAPADLGLEPYQNVDIAVMVPEEAGSADWTCYEVDYEGNASALEMHPAEAEGPSRRYAVAYTTFFQRGEYSRDQEIRLEWRDENGNHVKFAQLYVCTLTGHPKPWPYYVSEWKPVSAERLQIVKNHFVPGIDFTYDESIGLLTCTVDPDRLPQSANFGNISYDLQVTPPDITCTQRGTNPSGSGNNYGMAKANSEASEQLQRTRDHSAPYLENDKLLEDAALFRTFHQENRELTVYMTVEMTGPLAGGVHLISWWTADQDPMTDEPYLTEYIATKQEKCVRVMESDPYANENDLPSVITQPVIVLPQGSINHPEDGLKFVAEIYPQQSANSRYYRLKLVDEDGEPVELEAGQYKVFLPYPEGLTEEQKQSMVLRHMTDAHVEVENFSINGNTLHLTDKGLWFQAKSFSPFVLEWRGSDPGPGPGPSGMCPDDLHDMQYMPAESSNAVRALCRNCSYDMTLEMMVYNKPEDGRPIEPLFEESGNDWWMNWDVVNVEYAPAEAAGSAQAWTMDAPVLAGMYVARMTVEDVTTEPQLFIIGDNDSGCLHPALMYGHAFNGYGFFQMCPDCAHTAYVNLWVDDKVYTGEPVEQRLSMYGHNWLEMDRLMMEYAVNLGRDQFGPWSRQAPSEVGSYVVRMAVRGEEDMQSRHVYFFINQPLENCPHDTIYVDYAGESLVERCSTCLHEARVALAVSDKDDDGQPAEAVVTFSGDEWQQKDLIAVEYAHALARERLRWKKEAPVGAGRYAARVVFDGRIYTDPVWFEIRAVQPDPVTEVTTQYVTVKAGEGLAMSVETQLEGKRQWYVRPAGSDEFVAMACTAEEYVIETVKPEQNGWQYGCFITTQDGSVYGTIFVLEVLSNQRPPATGDTAPVQLWMCLMIVSAAACTVLWRRKFD